MKEREVIIFAAALVFLACISALLFANGLHFVGSLLAATCGLGAALLVASVRIK